jgi:hypothetical protein
MATPGNYKGRTKSAQLAAAVSSGFRCDPVHVPAGVSNFVVCPAGSVVTIMSINVAPSAGGITTSFANSNTGGPGDIIVNSAVLARDYKQNFYCPWPLLVSTPGNGEDVTFFVYPPAKGTSVD